MYLIRRIYTTLLLLGLSAEGTSSNPAKFHISFDSLVKTINMLTATDAKDQTFQYHYWPGGPLFRQFAVDEANPSTELAISHITYTRTRKLYFEKDPVTIIKKDRDLVLTFFTTKENWPSPSITFNTQTKTLSISEANVEIQEYNPRTTDTYEMVVQFKEPDRTSLSDKFWNGLE